MNNFRQPIAVVVVLFVTSGLFLSTNQAAQDRENVLTVDGALREAHEAYREGKLQKAVDLCHTALQINPDSAHAYYLLGMIFTDQKAFPEAERSLLRSISLDSSHIAAHISLGRLYLITEKWDSAEMEFREALKLGDATGEGDYGIGLALLGRSRDEEAMPYLHASVEANPQADRLFTLVATQLKVGQTTQAQASAVRLAQLSPRDPWLFFRLGKLLQEHHLLDEADSSLERSVDLLSDSRRTAATPPHGLSIPELLLDIGRLRFDQNDFSGSLRALERMDTTTGDPKVQTAALFLEGKALLALGQPKAASEKLSQAATVDPAILDIDFYWALAELEAGNSDGASKTMEMASVRWPNAEDISVLNSIVQRERDPDRLAVPFNAKWHVQGERLVCCPCNTPCPCRSNGSPTHGVCENTGVVRIEKGHYGDVQLDDFTFVIVNGSMGPETGSETLYVPPSVSNRQIIALERLFQSFNPLHVFTFLNIERTEIHVAESSDHTYSVDIPRVLKIKVRRRLDNTGKALQVTAALDNYSNSIEYAQNLLYKAWDKDGTVKWDYSGRQANYRTIDLDSDDYRRELMLIQFADWSGTFNHKQWELIRRLGLPTLPSYTAPPH